MRVVSLIPSATDTLLNIGAEADVVGKSHECPGCPGAVVLTADKVATKASSGTVDAVGAETTGDGSPPLLATAALPVGGTQGRGQDLYGLTAYPPSPPLARATRSQALCNTRCPSGSSVPPPPPQWSHCCHWHSGSTGSTWMHWFASNPTVR